MKVVDIISWMRKRAGQKKDEGSPTAAAPELAPSESVPQTEDERLTRLIVEVEAAKAASAMRERYEGENRNRRRRLVRGGAVLALVAGLFAFLGSSDESGNSVRIKTSVPAVAFPVTGAAAGTTKTGHIAVIKLNDGIGGDLTGPAVAANTPLYLQSAFAAVEEDPELAGVILVINSPGGGAAASDQAYRVVKAARERLAKRGVKMIAYTSSGAYSGGFFIAMAAGKGNYIADPASSVGNIGVIMSLWNTAGLGEKIGVTENIVKTGPLKSTGAQWEKLSPEQRAALEEDIGDAFEHFIDAVAQGRGLDRNDLLKEAKLPDGRTNGRWFSAKRALAKGLIDEIVPVENLYKYSASRLPDPKKWKAVEFTVYEPDRGNLEKLIRGAGRMTGLFLEQMYSQMTHREEPVRMERE